MALANLTGGPLDGQTIPLDDETLDEVILPYSETQLVYRRAGALENTGDGDGPTAANFAYVEKQGELVEDGDQSNHER